MKNVAIAVASLFTVIAPAAHAAYDRYGNYYEPRDEYRSGDYRDNYARVLDSRPVYAENRQECWNNRHNRYEARAEEHDNHVGAGTALGAVAGGVIGHQVGSGRGNDAATVGGALLGGLIGHNVEKNRRDDDNPDVDLNNCRTVAGRDLVGYDVHYAYNGNEYRTRMNADPGRRLVIGRDVNEDGTPFDVASGTYAPYYPSGGG